MAAVSLSVSTVKPLGDRVFVKVSESEEKTAGGILLPDTAKEKPQVGEVAQVGPGKRNEDGSRQFFGSLPAGNSTSKTGPITWRTIPLVPTVAVAEAAIR